MSPRLKKQKRLRDLIGNRSVYNLFRILKSQLKLNQNDNVGNKIGQNTSQKWFTQYKESITIEVFPSSQMAQNQVFHDNQFFRFFDRE